MFAKRMNKPIDRIPESVMQALCRELHNMV
jgi:hypothetical protein